MPIVLLNSYVFVWSVSSEEEETGLKKNPDEAPSTIRCGEDSLLSQSNLVASPVSAQDP
jgi:hypothetical protein